MERCAALLGEAAPHLDRGLVVALSRRARDDVDDAGEGVGAVQGGAWTADDLDAFDVGRGDGQERPERRADQIEEQGAPVDEDEDLVGQAIVEAAQPDVVVGRAVGHDVHARDPAEIVRDGRDAGGAQLLSRDDGDRVRRLEGALPVAGRRDDDRGIRIVNRGGAASDAVGRLLGGRPRRWRRRPVGAVIDCPLLDGRRRAGGAIAGATAGAIVGSLQRVDPRDDLLELLAQESQLLLGRGGAAGGQRRACGTVIRCRLRRSVLAVGRPLAHALTRHRQQSLGFGPVGRIGGDVALELHDGAVVAAGVEEGAADVVEHRRMGKDAIGLVQLGRAFLVLAVADQPHALAEVASRLVARIGESRRRWQQQQDDQRAHASLGTRPSHHSRPPLLRAVAPNTPGDQ